MSVLIILCLITITFVTSEMQVHRVFVSRKSSSDSAPIETGSLYKQVYKHPGIVSMFNTDTTTTQPILERRQLNKLLSLQYHPIDLTKQFKPAESALMKRGLDYDIAKAESKFLPTKIKTDLMYENLKSTMHPHPDGTNEVVYRFDDFNIDDNDVRTSSRGVYDNWPSYHPSPYEYEHNKMNSELSKAKDKRYSDSSKVIPIHEDLSHDIPESSFETYYTTDNYRDRTTDNPMTGHDPFFSFVLNDYFDKDNEYDHLSFRDIHWGKDFDVEDYPKRNRRLEKSYLPSDQGITSSHLHRGQDEIEADTVTEKGFNKKHDFSKHEKGDKESMNDKIKHDQNEHKHTDFKDFLNIFANKFGTEDDKKTSGYVLRKNQDNGENRKGFHRVYHKDEYMEDKEFYNNNNNSANFEDKANANAHIGGSEGLQASYAAAALGNQSSNLHKSSDAENSAFKKNHVGYDANKGYDANFKRYRDVAKQTAMSNNADYSDHL